MKSKEKLIGDVKNQPVSIRIAQIEQTIDNSEKLKSLLEQKKLISKEIVLARKLGLENTVLDYQRQYREIDDEIKKYPLIEEYMDLLDIAHNDLELMVNYLEQKINQHIKNDKY